MSYHMVKGRTLSCRQLHYLCSGNWQSEDRRMGMSGTLNFRNLRNGGSYLFNRAGIAVNLKANVSFFVSICCDGTVVGGTGTQSVFPKLSFYDLIFFNHSYGPKSRYLHPVETVETLSYMFWVARGNRPAVADVPAGIAMVRLSRWYNPSEGIPVD